MKYQPSEVRLALSPREHEVLEYVAKGDNDRVIAKRMSIAPATVKAHMRNAKAKLNAQTRPHAVALALVSGVIPSGESFPGLDADVEEPEK